MRKRNLTRELICEAAIQLIETDGLEKLSMRNLAEQVQNRSSFFVQPPRK